jgi:hypothetical protein
MCAAGFPVDGDDGMKDIYAMILSQAIDIPGVDLDSVRGLLERCLFGSMNQGEQGASSAAE